MAHRPNLSTRSSVEVFESNDVLAWHDEDVAGRDGVSVHEGHDDLVLIDHTGLVLTGRYGAKDTRLRGR